MVPGKFTDRQCLPAGQPAQFMLSAALHFREGNRKDPQMSPMAASLSNAT